MKQKLLKIITKKLEPKKKTQKTKNPNKENNPNWVGTNAVCRWQGTESVNLRQMRK